MIVPDNSNKNLSSVYRDLQIQGPLEKHIGKYIGVHTGAFKGIVLQKLFHPQKWSQWLKKLF